MDRDWDGWSVQGGRGYKMWVKGGAVIHLRKDLFGRSRYYVYYGPYQHRPFKTLEAAKAKAEGLAK